MVYDAPAPHNGWLFLKTPFIDEHAFTRLKINLA
jgi:hypothetical protein